jgi:hypothetical protein
MSASILPTGTIMRQLCVGLMAGLALLPAGCFLFPSGKPFWSSRPTPKNEPSGPNVIYMEAAFVTTAIGDRYINDELWTAVDEQILTSAQRLKLQENGLRVGLVRGRPPAGLQDLLTSKKAHKGQGFARPSGNPAILPLVSEIKTCEFPLAVEGESKPVRFEDAACRFQVTPALDRDSKVRLQFTPQIEFRDPDKWKHLNPALAISVQGQRSTESFPALGWEVSLGPNEYVVVGARFDKRQSLGFNFFVTPDPERPVQRLIAIRTSRPANSTDGKSSQAGSVASQAGGQ